MKWFKHDANAHRDAKIKRLKHQYGIVGYGIYWYCIELIAESIDKNNVTFELEEDAGLIALEWNLDQLKVQEIMLFMVEIGLFENENGVITCFKLAKRMDDTNARNPEIKQILTKMLGFNMTKSEKVGESSEIFEQTRLDKTRLEEKDQEKGDLSPIGDEPEAPPERNKIKKQNIPYQKIVDLYHSTLPELPQVKELSNKRKSYIRQRWLNNLGDMENWGNFFQYIRMSPFLMGKVEPKNGKRVFVPNLEWLTTESNYIKIYEGNYHDKQ